MFKNPLPKMLLFGASIACALAAPSESHALFDWFGGGGGGHHSHLHHHHARPAYVPAPVPAPVAVVPATVPAPAPVAGCNPCGPAVAAVPCAPPVQAVTYVPETNYRTVCYSVPTTCYQPVVTCDPCTGCPVTCYQPVVTYTERCCQVPYTTYRAVYAPVGAPAAAPSAGHGCFDHIGKCFGWLFGHHRQTATPVTYGYAPMNYAAPAPNCGGCAPSGGAYYTPSQEGAYAPGPAASFAPSPDFSAPQPSGGFVPTPQPSLDGAGMTSPPSGAQPQTFRREPLEGATEGTNGGHQNGSGANGANGTGGEDDVKLQPIPDSQNQKTKLFQAPQLRDPRDKTAGASAPSNGASIVPAVYSQQVDQPATPARAPGELGWHAAGSR